MRLRPFAALLFATACIPGFASGAWASKSAPQVERIPPSALDGRVADPARAGSVCTLGKLDPAFTVNYIQPPNDGYYTLVHPADCATCSGTVGGILTDVHLQLYYPVPCSVPVTISLVGASGDPSCRVPDVQNVICAPVHYDLDSPAAGYRDFTFTLAQPCLFGDDAFLAVTFTSAAAACSSGATRPRLVVSASCASCRSYNIYPGGNDDICAVQLPGNPIMWAELSSCLAANSGVGAPDPEGALRIVNLGPNPGSERALEMTVALREGPARVEIFDLLGHRVAARELGSPGAGIHRVPIARGLELRPGLYLVRVAQGTGAVARKITILR